MWELLSTDDLLRSGEMKLPGVERAVADIAKLRDYCLNPSHPRGRHQARMFAAVLGLAQADAEFLREELLRAVREEDATKGDFDDYGERFIVDFELTRNDRKARIEARGSSAGARDFRGSRVVMYYEIKVYCG